MSILAIKGHSKRGSEVIERLEMLGGINSHNLYGDENYAYYTIDSDKEIKGGIYVFGDEQLCYFTLEEFEENFPYKVGDRVRVADYESEVRIDSMNWDGNEVQYEVFTDMTEWYSAEELNLFNEPYKEKTMEEDKGTLVAIDLTLEFKKANEIEVILGDYEFVLKDGKTYFVKKNKYPKTYEECCKVLGIDIQFCMKYLPHGTFSYRDTLIYNLQELIICRDAYWKIAGKEMGLDKPWEPDFTNTDDCYFAIKTCKGKISLISTLYIEDCILVFPTAEMRDDFYENFKELINDCKELL